MGVRAAPGCPRGARQGREHLAKAQGRLPALRRWSGTGWRSARSRASVSLQEGVCLALLLFPPGFGQAALVRSEGKWVSSQPRWLPHAPCHEACRCLGLWGQPPAPDGETPGGCQQPPGDGERLQPHGGELCPPLPACGSTQDRAGCCFIHFWLCLGPYKALGTSHRAAAERGCAHGLDSAQPPGVKSCLAAPGRACRPPQTASGSLLVKGARGRICCSCKTARRAQIKLPESASSLSAWASSQQVPCLLQRPRQQNPATGGASCTAASRLMERAEERRETR